MSILGAVQFLGFAIMPGMFLISDPFNPHMAYATLGAGSLLSFIPKFYIAGATFDKFTLPGYVLAITSLALLVLIIFEFKNPPPLIVQVGGTKTPAPTPAPEARSPPLVPAPISPISPHQSNPHLNSPHVLGPMYHPQSPHIPTAILVDSQFTPPQFHPQQFSDAPFQPQFPTHVPQYIPSHIPPHMSPHFSPAIRSPVFMSPQLQPVFLPLPHSPQLRSPLISESPFPAHSPVLKHHPSQIDDPLTPPSTPSPPPETSPLTRRQRFLIFGVFLVLNLMVRLVLGIIETIATPVYIQLNDNKPGKDVEAGFVFGGLGLIGMGVLFLISYLSKFIQDFKILVSGLSTMVLGAGLLIGDLSLPRFIIGCGFIWCVGYPLAQV
jgi:hypothetical protein